MRSITRIDTQGSLAERFWAKVNKDGPVPAHVPELGPCWIWTACLIDGYGAINIDHRMIRSPRVSWALAFGDQNDLCVLHKCDNRACVNPDHLFLGTVQDNNRDMTEKGRRRFVVQRGELHGQARLTESLVADARARRAAGAKTKRMARELGVSETTLRNAVKRKTWKHVP